MTVGSKKKGLGAKGLGIEALISTKMEDYQEANQMMNAAPLAEGGVIEIDINKIEPNRKQPRKQFDETALEELAESLKNFGVIQPIIVKKAESGDYYELVAGERRFRAAKIAGLLKLPAIVKEIDNEMAFEIALIENLQREDLNPLEEAESYRRLNQEFSMSQEQISQRVGKSRSAVTNALRLLQLDARVQNFVLENKLSGGHARTLLMIPNGDMQFELAEKIIEEGYSVRAVEALVKEELEKMENPSKESAPKKGKSFNVSKYPTIENDLKSIFATKVKISSNKNKGKIEIEYYSDEDLDRLIGIIKGNTQ